MITMNINFFVRGVVSQKVTLLNTSLIFEEIQHGLNSGKYVTELHANDSYIIDAVTKQKIAKIEKVELDIYPSDFEVSEA